MAHKRRRNSIRYGDHLPRRRKSNDASPMSEVDLHGLRHHIGETRVRNFMREQIENGAHAVKIIHGHGQGVMREVAYDWIRAHPEFIAHTEDVGPAVIVYLRH